MCEVRNKTIGEECVDGLQDLLRRMRSGLPIPVTEIRRVVTPSGQTMIVSETKEITFGESQDDEQANQGSDEGSDEGSSQGQEGEEGGKA